MSWCVCTYLVAKSCLTFHDLMDYDPPGSSIHGISRQQYRNRLPFLFRGCPLKPEIEPESHCVFWLAGVNSLPVSHQEAQWVGTSIVFRFPILYFLIK